MIQLIARALRALVGTILIAAWLTLLVQVLRLTSTDWPSTWTPSGDVTFDFALTILRLVVGALSLWLMAATVVDLARTTREVVVHRHDRCAPPPGSAHTHGALPRVLRRALITTLVVGIAGTSPAQAQTAGPGDEPETATLMWAAGAATSTTVTPSATTIAPTSTTALHRTGPPLQAAAEPATTPDAATPAVAEATAEPDRTIDDETVAPRAGLRYRSPSTTELSSADPAAAGTAPPAPTTQQASADTTPIHPSRDAGTWTVRPGEHFWSIAEQALTDDGFSSPSEHDVAAYWLRLIEANLDQLVRPGDADLLLPGQTLVLPPR